MMDELPPNLDKRANGRCRAYWMAYDHSPGNRNPFEWGLENFTKFLGKAAILDQEEGMLKACNSYRKGPKPIRTRKRRKNRV